MDFIISEGISLRGMSCISWFLWGLISLGGNSAFQGFSGYSSKIKAIQGNLGQFKIIQGVSIDFRGFQWNWRYFKGL